jgi:hypothetical protein
MISKTALLFRKLKLKIISRNHIKLSPEHKKPGFFSLHKATSLIKMLRSRGVAPGRSSSTRWCFTVNHPTDEDEEAVKNMVNRDECLQATVGREVGESGTPHLQGFAVFIGEVQRATLERMLGGRAHLEVMRGTVRQNQTYCRKQGNLMIEKGGEGRPKNEEKKSKREMWAEVLAAAKAKNPAEFQLLYPEHWMIRRNAVERIMIEAQGQRTEIWTGDLQTKNIWIWGAPGLGKSRWAAGQNPVPSVYKKNGNKWWDGFDPLTHVQVTIEDWALNLECLAGHLKLWSDRYPFIGEVKGSSFLMEPGKWNLIVTSNYSIEECFNETDRVAIRRRFAEIEMTAENKALIDVTRITPP